MNGAIFISWESHQRTRTLCKKLGIPLFEIVVRAGRIRRYLSSTAQTFTVIRRNKPRVVFVQNPSMVLTVFCTLLKPFLGFKLIVDAHNEAINPYIHNNVVIRSIARFLIRVADSTIVTNAVLADQVSRISGRPIVIPDFLPDREPRQPTVDSQAPPYTVTFICTYAPDEPYLEVFEAARAIPDLVNIYVTGGIPEHVKRMELPENVRLLGYLSEEDYWKQLYQSHLIIDLTTMPDCLVCGAYEAISIQVPAILSESKASKSTFPIGVVLTENSATEIVNAIHHGIDNYHKLTFEVQELRSQFIEKENSYFSLLDKAMGN
jgi:glycosyltransferase involved in cell wall biosynthesis